MYSALLRIINIIYWKMKNRWKTLCTKIFKFHVDRLWKTFTIIYWKFHCHTKMPRLTRSRIEYHLTHVSELIIISSTLNYFYLQIFYCKICHKFYNMQVYSKVQKRPKSCIHHINSDDVRLRSAIDAWLKDRHTFSQNHYRLNLSKY